MENPIGQSDKPKNRYRRKKMKSIIKALRKGKRVVTDGYSYAGKYFLSIGTDGYLTLKSESETITGALFLSQAKAWIKNGKID
jgi:hypothetical protein